MGVVVYPFWGGGGGAIVERGSNANGEYVRFADGTQICQIADAGRLSVERPIGSTYRSLWATWTFPAAFAVPPVLAGRTSTTRRWVTATSEATFAKLVQHAGAKSTTARPTAAIAIGRWF